MSKYILYEIIGMVALNWLPNIYKIWKIKVYTYKSLSLKIAVRNISNLVLNTLKTIILVFNYEIYKTLIII